MTVSQLNMPINIIISGVYITPGQYKGRLHEI